LWKWDLQLKIKLLVWLAKDQIFLTWDILQKKGWEGPSMCVLCKRSTEDINHLFIDCLFTKKVWNRIKTIQNHKRMREGKTLSECFYFWIKDKSVSPTLATIICLCIWTKRNMEIFESTVPSNQSVFIKVLALYKQQHSSQFCIPIRECMVTHFEDFSIAFFLWCY